jgi:hypothetical protein
MRRSKAGKERDRIDWEGKDDGMIRDSQCENPSERASLYRIHNCTLGQSDGYETA